jgi:hypothetical protein
MEANVEEVKDLAVRNLIAEVIPIPMFLHTILLPLHPYPHLHPHPHPHPQAKIMEFWLD